MNPGNSFDNRNRTGTPILVPDGYFKKESIRESFLKDSEKLEPWIRKLVSEKILLFENEEIESSES